LGAVALGQTPLCNTPDRAKSRAKN